MLNIVLILMQKNLVDIKLDPNLFSELILNCGDQY